MVEEKRCVTSRGCPAFKKTWKNIKFNLDKKPSFLNYVGTLEPSSQYVELLENGVLFTS